MYPVRNMPNGLVIVLIYRKFFEKHPFIGMEAMLLRVSRVMAMPLP